MAWSYTPRQLAAWNDLAYRRRCGELADELINLTTSKAKTRSIQDRLKRLMEEAQ